jgi:hypothetical protein
MKTTFCLSFHDLILPWTKPPPAIQPVIEVATRTCLKGHCYQRYVRALKLAERSFIITMLRFLAVFHKKENSSKIPQQGVPEVQDKPLEIHIHTVNCDPPGRKLVSQECALKVLSSEN